MQLHFTNNYIYDSMQIPHYISIETIIKYDFNECMFDTIPVTLISNPTYMVMR